MTERQLVPSGSRTSPETGPVAPATPRPSGWGRTYLVIWVWCAGLAVLTHLPMLFKPHREGDELVYLALAEAMHWDFSNYTTQDDPRVNRFPYSIYRKPLFHHPPLYPYLLKIGLAWTDNPLLEIPGVRTPTIPRGELSPIVPDRAVTTGFLIATLSTIAATFYAWRLMALLNIGPAYGGVALLAMVLCPVTLFSTVRMHHDGLAGLLMFCGVVAFAEALTWNRVGPAIVAALWLTAAFNTRYNSILMLPVLAVLPWYVRFRANRAELPSLGEAKDADIPRGPAWWIVPAIVLASVATFGMQHFYRLLATYGTISPAALIQPTADVANFSPFLTFVETRINRRWILSELGLIFPLAILFLARSVLKGMWGEIRNRTWAGAMILMAAYLFAMHLGLSYRQLRYFAGSTVFLHACWPWLLATYFRDRVRWPVVGLGVLTLFLMVTTGFFNATMAEPEQMMLMPSATLFWPPLLEGYQL